MTGAALIAGCSFALAAVAGFALSLYLLAVTIIGLFARLSAQSLPAGTRFAVVIPAHNESLLIARTIQSIKESDYPRNLFDIIVIADNCTDDTAAIAGGEGVRCFKRFDGTNKGKGYALQWLFENAAREQWKYDAYIVIDADSVIAKDLLQIVNDHVSSGFEVLTCFHMVQGAASSPALDLVKLGFLLRNARCAGISALGGSAPLLGSGMCLSQNMIRRFGWTACSIAEDREEWASLYANGVNVRYLPDAKVLSEMPHTVRDLGNPRARWDRGQMRMVRTFLPSFAGRFAKERSIGSLVTLLELITPPFALLYFFMTLAAAVALLFPLLPGRHTLALWIANCTLMGVCVLAAMLKGKASLGSYARLFLSALFLVPVRVFNLVRESITRGGWRRTRRVGPSKGEAE